MVPLLGCFKGEHHTKQHLLISCATSGSGIRVKLWLSRVIAVHNACKRSSGPAFVNSHGYQSTTSDMNELFLDVLVDIYEDHPKLTFPDLETCPRSSTCFARRGSKSRAVAMRVAEVDRCVVNRWKKEGVRRHRKGGSCYRPKLCLHDYGKGVLPEAHYCNVKGVGQINDRVKT